MFELNLAHIHRAERERELVTDLRAREILKTAETSTATEPAAVRRAPTARSTTTRALGR